MCNIKREFIQLQSRLNGNDQELIQPNSTSCPRHQTGNEHKQIRHHKVKQHKQRGQPFPSSWSPGYPKWRKRRRINSHYQVMGFFFKRSRAPSSEVNGPICLISEVVRDFMPVLVDRINTEGVSVDASFYPLLARLTRWAYSIPDESIGPSPCFVIVGHNFLSK